MIGQKVTQGELERIESVLIGIFGPRLDTLAIIEQKRISILQLIETTNGIFPGHRMYNTLMLIKECQTHSNGNLLTFMKNIFLRKSQFELEKNELSEYILREIQIIENSYGSEEDFSIFFDIYDLIVKNQTEEYIQSYIQTSPHPKQITNGLSHISDIQLRKSLEDSLVFSSNQEVKFLMQYLAEVEEWAGKEFLRMDVSFFSHKIGGMLYGSNEPYLGLISIFHDDELKRMILKHPAFLQLAKFNLQIMYIKDLRKKISSFISGDWTEFNQFYREIKLIASKLINEFGNEGLAEKLLKAKKEIEEYPDKWLQFMDFELNKIVSERRSNVIIPFIKLVGSVFRSRLNKISGKDLPEKDKLKNIMEELFGKRISLLKGIAGDIIKTLRKVLHRQTKGLNKEIKKFNQIMIRCIDAFDDFLAAKERYIDEEINKPYKERLREAYRIFKASSQTLTELPKLVEGDMDMKLDDDKFSELMARFSIGKSTYDAVNRNIRMMKTLFVDTDKKRGYVILNKSLKRAELAYSDLDKFLDEKFGRLLQTLDHQNEEVAKNGR